MAVVEVIPTGQLDCLHVFEPLGLSGPLPTERCRCSATRYTVTDGQVSDVVEVITQALTAKRVTAVVAWDRRR